MGGNDSFRETRVSIERLVYNFYSGRKRAPLTSGGFNPRCAPAEGIRGSRVKRVRARFSSLMSDSAEAGLVFRRWVPLEITPSNPAGTKASHGPGCTVEYPISRRRRATLCIHRPPLLSARAHARVYTDRRIYMR